MGHNIWPGSWSGDSCMVVFGIRACFYTQWYDHACGVLAFDYNVYGDVSWYGNVGADV